MGIHLNRRGILDIHGLPQARQQLRKFFKKEVNEFFQKARIVSGDRQGLLDIEAVRRACRSIMISQLHARRTFSKSIRMKYFYPAIISCELQKISTEIPFLF